MQQRLFRQLNDLFGKLNNLFPIKDSKLEKDYRSKEATDGTIKLEEDAVKNVGNVSRRLGSGWRSPPGRTGRRVTLSSMR